MTGGVGGRIRAKREEKKISQTKLAKKASISQSGLSSIEACSSSPKEETLKLIAEALGCTAAELMGESVETRTPTDEELKFALFGGDVEITDAQFEEVKQFAHFIKERESGGHK